METSFYPKGAEKMYHSFTKGKINKLRKRSEVLRGKRILILSMGILLTIAFVPIRVSSALVGDFNNDGKVDYDDFLIFKAAYGATTDKSNWNPACDIAEPKGKIDFEDYMIFLINYEKKCPETPEEVLQRVAVNYGLVNDMKADMITSSTFEGKPFGDTHYSRYYFKKPNKVKMELFSSPHWTTKIGIIIIDGPNMYLVDPSTGQYQELNLLEQTGLNSSQFTQMDACFNLDEFLVNHNITMTGVTENIGTIEATPKIANNLYSKLEMQVDCEKGLIVRSMIYRGGKLIETIETKESRWVNELAWIPVKMVKVPLLEAGEFRTMMIYENMAINTGISDSEFSP